jgi:prepilin-type processing-associated H-X9-DG protein
MLLPTLTRARQKAQGIGCINNLRQLQLAEMMFADDNNDKLPRNTSNGSGTETDDPLLPEAQPDYNGPNVIKSAWVLGQIGDFGTAAAAAVNVECIRHGQLFPYTKKPGIYKDPADKRRVPNGQPTIRSMSMNAWVGTVTPESDMSTAYRIFRKMADIPKPSQVWVFIDENPGSINDGFFKELPDNLDYWVDIPATYHGRSGGITFADGHVQLKKWTDANIFNVSSYGAYSPGSADLNWLLSLTTSKK